MPLKIKFVVFLFILSFNTASACEKGMPTIFSCVTDNGKTIEVCDAGKTINYSFGKASEKPEIIIKALRESASTTQWAGFGRSISYAVNIPNGNTLYNVFGGMDRLSDEHPVEAGVSVEINQKYAATIRCSNKNKIIQNIDGINLSAAQ